MGLVTSVCVESDENSAPGKTLSMLSVEVDDTASCGSGASTPYLRQSERNAAPLPPSMLQCANGGSEGPGPYPKS